MNNSLSLSIVTPNVLCDRASDAVLRSTNLISLFFHDSSIDVNDLVTKYITCRSDFWGLNINAPFWTRYEDSNSEIFLTASLFTKGALIFPYTGDPNYINYLGNPIDDFPRTYTHFNEFTCYHLSDGSKDFIKETIKFGNWQSVPLTNLTSEVWGGAFAVVPIEKYFLPNPNEKDESLKQISLKARVSNRGMVLAEAQASLPTSRMGGDRIEQISEKVFSKIFASYSRKDIEVVKTVDSILSTFGTADLRWDLKILRSGDNWWETICQEIRSCDSFQLFWSQNSSESEQVRKEWTHALECKPDPGFIRPVYWKEPLPPPPPELEELHFAKIDIKV